MTQGNQTDALTGLLNRPALGVALKEAIDVGDGVAIGLMDIDNFDTINATFGHETGDLVLRAIGQLIGETAPGNAFRLSGDEFAIVMPGSSLEQAFLRVEALRVRVQAAAATIGVPDGREMHITGGVAQVPRDAKDARGLLEAADAALESAKENGRNQVALPSNEEMVMKSCYYPATQVRKLKVLAERLNRKESHLLREALDEIVRKYDVLREA